MSAHTSFVVYQDLNDAGNVIVARADEVVVGTFTLAAGPFDDEAKAKKEAERLRREGTLNPTG